MHSEILTVTPDMAKEFLETSKVNPRFGDTKKYNKTVVSKYAADMKAGRWKLTHQSIAFNESGELIDGHNRLTAVILSGASVPMYVTYDAPNESVIIDRGWLRTTAQTCLYDFEKNKKRTRRYQNPEAIYTKKFLSVESK